MDSNIPKPDWLTDELIEELKLNIAECDNPYTDEEVGKINFDDYIDWKRYNAAIAKDILTKYGIV